MELNLTHSKMLMVREIISNLNPTEDPVQKDCLALILNQVADNWDDAEDIGNWAEALTNAALACRRTQIQILESQLKLLREKTPDTFSLIQTLNS